MSIDTMLSDLSTKAVPVQPDTPPVSATPAPGVFSIDQIVKSTALTTPITPTVSPPSIDIPPSQNQSWLTPSVRKYLSLLCTMIVVGLCGIVFVVRYPIESQEIVDTFVDLLAIDSQESTASLHTGHTAAPIIDIPVDTTPTPISDGLAVDTTEQTIPVNASNQSDIAIDQVFVSTIDMIRAESTSTYDTTNTSLRIRYITLAKQIMIYDTLTDETAKASQEEGIRNIYNSIISTKNK